jgi:uncharacterized membrane protein
MEDLAECGPAEDSPVEAGSPEGAVFRVAVEDLAAAAPGEVGEAMKTKHLFRELDHDRIMAAITEAEKHTTGEIRVYVSHRKVHDPRHAAVHQFAKMGLDKTKHRNAVLIFIAPESQNFAVIGDEAVHAKCGEGFWEEIVGAMRDYFRQGKFTEGVVHGISTAGKLLAEHFPAQRQ